MFYFDMCFATSSIMDKQDRREYKHKWMSAKRSLAKRTLQVVDSTHADPPCSATDNDDDAYVDHAMQDNQAFNCLAEADINTDHESMAADGLASEDDNNEQGEIDSDLQSDLDLIDNHVTLSSDSDNGASDDEHLERALVSWVNSYGVNHNAVDGLMKILKRHGHPDLPSSSRGLLGTMRSVPTEVKSGMDYVYLGLAPGIKKNLDAFRPDVNTINLSLNIDGLPLFKSSGKCLWPVLCALHSVPVRVFTVALTYGTSKPSNLDFLLDTTREPGELMQHGLRNENRNIQINLKCIICDAPLRPL